MIGTYSLPDGRAVTITGSGAAGALRVTLAGQTQAGAKRPLIVRDISVISGGIPLHGKLVYPASGRTNVAAVRALRHMAPTIAKVGVCSSQGGWVAPLVQRLVPLDFVIPAFAMAEGPIAQDRELVELQLRAAGFSEPALRLARAHQNHGARHAVDSDGWVCRPASGRAGRVQGAARSCALAGSKPRQLWLLAGSDRQAPNLGTQRILKHLQQRGRSIDLVVFPRADHA